MAKFQTPVDIANRALQRCGATRIASFTDDSKNASETAFVYDKVRDAELRRNVWTFATRRAVIRPVNTNNLPPPVGGSGSGPTMLFTPAIYSSTATYVTGSVVQFNGEWYQALRSVPANQQPDLNTQGSDQESFWTQYFGPRTVTQWTFNADQSSPQPWSPSTTYAAGQLAIGSDEFEYSSVTNGNVNNNPVTDGGVHWTKQGQIATNGGYFAGELVYYPTGPNPSVYLSLNTGNSDVPTTVPAWVNTGIYSVGQTVLFNSVVYQSQIDLNVNSTPVALWLVGTTYGNAAQVIGSDNHLYTSTGAGNVGHNPVGNAGVNWTDNGLAPWGLQPNTQPDLMMGINWLKLGNATVRSLQLVYPAGSGPVTQSATRNVYVLPYGFLREAPQDPKAGSTSYLGAPSGLTYDDWVYENGLIVTREVYPITLRFVADVADVTLMDPMFCEGMACRIATEVCETLTQSTTKLSAIVSAYNRFMTEARMVNGIEQGPTEAPEDDYITCRR
jgi:hypothetical protein